MYSIPRSIGFGADLELVSFGVERRSGSWEKTTATADEHTIEERLPDEIGSKIEGDGE